MANYNKAYHSFWEGYTEQKITDPKTGKTRIKRVYTGYFYRATITDREWKKTKILYSLSVLISIVLFFAGTNSYLSGNTTWYVVLPTAFVLLSMMWFLSGFVEFILAPRDIKEGTFGERKTVVSGSGLASMFFFLSAVTVAVHGVCGKDGTIVAHILTCTSYLISGALIGFVHITEKNMVYDKVKSNAKIEGEAYDIDYPRVNK